MPFFCTWKRALLAADVAAAQGCDSFSMTICTLAKKTNLYIPFPYSKGLQDKQGLCTFKHKFVHTPCTFKQKFVHTLCTFKHFHEIKEIEVWKKCPKVKP